MEINIYCAMNKAGFILWSKYLQHREEGRKIPLGYINHLNKKLYFSIANVGSWDPIDSTKCAHHGGVFNLEFSPEGSLLVAATERKSILIFDPLNHKLVNYVNEAHNDCVNYARFLDSRMFATCSDDTTVALWDIRYLKHKIRTLKGHSNWVKNIEFASNVGLLVTSGFDGSIYTWDINRYSEEDIQFQRVFHTNGLMRMRLTSDNSKMVICTTGGYLMVIHNLDLNNLAEDLMGFKPNMYRLMQMGNTPFPIGYSYNHLFTAQRNRIELISDFPEGNDAEIISSLQVHPYGWCVLSRNTSSDENTEWTCIHDIQEVEKPYGQISDDSQLTTLIGVSRNENETVNEPNVNNPENFNSVESNSLEISREVSGSQSLREQPVVHIRLNYGPQSVRHQEINRSDSQGNRNITTESYRFGNIELRISQRRITQSVSPGILNSVNSQEGTSGVSPPSPPLLTRMNSDDSNSSEEAENNSTHIVPPERPAFFIRTGSERGAHTFLLLGPNRSQDQTNHTSHKIYRNTPRLTHYISEPNVGRGFIKELCFSTDGRLICSPYGYGVRLLTFHPSCSELCDSVPASVSPLHELRSDSSHSNYVVSTKFSPTHCLFVSGCLSGKICFHQPVI